MTNPEFEAIYTRYFTLVYRYLMGLCGSVQRAEELTSDTFFKALRSIGSFRGECDIGTWLCRIARNSYYSSLRSLKYTQPEEKTEPIDPAPGLEERLLRRESADFARQALAELPEPYREVFCLRHWGEMSFKDIGLVFEKSENWACVTYHRARLKLREKLEGEE